MLLNMQHLLNSFRPFQAREQLISELQGQLDDKRGLIELLGAQRDKCSANSHKLDAIMGARAGKPDTSTDAAVAQPWGSMGAQSAAQAQRKRG